MRSAKKNYECNQISKSVSNIFFCLSALGGCRWAHCALFASNYVALVETWCGRFEMEMYPGIGTHPVARSWTSNSAAGCSKNAHYLGYNCPLLHSRPHTHTHTTMARNDKVLFHCVQVKETKGHNFPLPLISYPLQLTSNRCQVRYN